MEFTDCDIQLGSIFKDLSLDEHSVHNIYKVAYFKFADFKISCQNVSESSSKPFAASFLDYCCSIFDKLKHDKLIEWPRTERYR